MEALNFLSYLAQKRHIIAVHTFLDKQFGGIAGWGGRLWIILLVRKSSCLEREIWVGLIIRMWDEIFVKTQANGFLATEVGKEK